MTRRAERERGEREAMKERDRRREPPLTVAAMESGGGDGVRRRWSETQTGSLCLGPVVCVSDRWFVSRSGGRCLDPVVLANIQRVIDDDCRLMMMMFELFKIRLESGFGSDWLTRVKLQSVRVPGLSGSA
ncbi:hypothetical protein HanRHA438_Chr11g0495101 [Helianthus annuus]|nr:hypothetical protein HanHA300_Chr11g0395061 [Helianthus annuus]KAJ0516834.1 hypothetical protein HanHA89_Chr11g0418241 [Helianthus annuus]KAJ0684839.1 hypothetical protein HanLR1_Chr11g0395671 [Helianthus annuus]KAJ0869982.1 hypothetical protein HanRHA438_Chr11g0495101 [Helianthus annuus]